MKKNWIKFISRELVDVTTISGLDVVFYDCIKQSYKNIHEPFFTVVQDRVLTHYICVDPHIVGKKIYQKYFSSPARVKRYYANGLSFLKIIRASAAKWQDAKKRDAGNWRLLAFLEFRKQFNKINYDFSIWPWWGLESWQTDCNRVIKKLIKKRGLENMQEEIVYSVYGPWKKTAIIKLQEEIRHGASFDVLVEKYQFLRNWAAIWYRAIDAEWVKKFSAEGKPEIKIKNISPAKLLELLRPNAEEKKFIEIAPFVIFFKDWRDDVRREFVFRWSFLFDAIADKFGIDRNDLGYLSLDELERGLRGGKMRQDKVSYRRSHPCVITGDIKSLKMKVLDKNIEKYLDIVNEIAVSSKKQSEIRGMVAQVGKARGVVKILRTYHDVKRVQEGDILVANTTHPNYLPAMRKAAAFVTNEGGIVSHAAIVAREMKKPCIVGTKNAMQVLKEGDLVEVDADQGVVRKL